MSQDLAGTVAIVTGGSDGIGRATAALLARRGATVVICARRPEVLGEAKKAIEGEGGKIETFQLDVSDEAAFAGLARQRRENPLG